MLWLISA
ncbi:hypothetical protein VCHC32A1_2659, partial [Vibrio cholerae HC-32A1]